MRKKESTDYTNEQSLFQLCERNSAISMISGRWKGQIVYYISQGNDRFHLLQQKLPNISETVLARQLKELERHAILVKREIPNTVPAGIKYILTNKGIDLVPILDSLCKWGKMYADGKEISIPTEGQPLKVANQEIG
ncbi:helix-turn-helix transcriptional regulator [Chitinophaga pendula]|uniref:winged helix-turn-helix transcriptional regulator n=1 Tax=Chitinophaga TaxID=79328 RepID=UPI000BAECC30|nr:MULTISPECIES: helix-turn-helix domain-containing protein [Chitinophaga]ASZ13506.1 transcriptional regulator [Chitinophaga sp. MD30]UCJ08865.1 helix-turn-helix transcriptional regulator [Chitinophaga pendula]